MSRYRPLSQIRFLVIHCADTPNGANFNAIDIDNWHKEAGFQRDPKTAKWSNLKHIGYHYVVELGGVVTKGRKLDETGAHEQKHNYNGIGTCIIGLDKFTLDQWNMLRDHVKYLEKRFPGIKVIGHREADPARTCPGFDVQAWRQAGMEPLAGHILESS